MMFLIIYLEVFVVRPVKWLIGSRRTYFQQGPTTVSLAWKAVGNSTEKNLCVSAERVLGFNPGAVIEVNQGILRRRSAIHHSKWWRLNQVVYGWMDNTDRIGITLCDEQGVSVEAALRLINSYPSLQAMLDRIVQLEIELETTNARNRELERSLEAANERRTEWMSATCALRLLIRENKRLYRAPSAMHLLKCLEAILDWAMFSQEPFADAPKMATWKARFPGYFRPGERDGAILYHPLR